MYWPEDYNEFHRRWVDFTEKHIAPRAEQVDREEHIPEEVIQVLRRQGAFASGFPAAKGGPAGDPEDLSIRHGLMHEALGAGSASIQGLVNVHHMGGSIVARWGNAAQKDYWVPRLTSGECLAGLAITEPNVGSDAAAVELQATAVQGGYTLEGTKTWITCGQSADVFFVLSRTEKGPAIFIVPSNTEGLTRTPIRGMLGCRGYMLATLQFERCYLPEEFLIGRPPFGLTHLAATGLDHGRLNLAWACVGMARTCLEACIRYTQTRRQFNAPLAEFQLVQRMICRMTTDIEAARLLCWKASSARGRNSPAAVKATTVAKYFASQAINRIAADAVQIHGAIGCSAQSPLQRILRDAKIMELIEGSTQVLETAIARYSYSEMSA
jgi:glutaryl-CoA dehydrogenase (non-decarboxylating)